MILPDGRTDNGFRELDMLSNILIKDTKIKEFLLASLTIMLMLQLLGQETQLPKLVTVMVYYTNRIW